jgi:hypothetical protein
LRRADTKDDLLAGGVERTRRRRIGWPPSRVESQYLVALEIRTTYESLRHFSRAFSYCSAVTRKRRYSRGLTLAQGPEPDPVSDAILARVVMGCDMTCASAGAGGNVGVRER